MRGRAHWRPEVSPRTRCLHGWGALRAEGPQQLGGRASGAGSPAATQRTWPCPGSSGEWQAWAALRGWRPTPEGAGPEAGSHVGPLLRSRAAGLRLLCVALPSSTRGGSERGGGREGMRVLRPKTSKCCPCSRRCCFTGFRLSGPGGPPHALGVGSPPHCRVGAEGRDSRHRREGKGLDPLGLLPRRPPRTPRQVAGVLGLCPVCALQAQRPAAGSGPPPWSPTTCSEGWPPCMDLQVTLQPVSHMSLQLDAVGGKTLAERPRSRSRKKVNISFAVILLH